MRIIHLMVDDEEVGSGGGCGVTLNGPTFLSFKIFCLLTFFVVKSTTEKKEEEGVGRGGEGAITHEGGE